MQALVKKKRENLKICKQFISQRKATNRQHTNNIELDINEN